MNPTETDKLAMSSTPTRQSEPLRESVPIEADAYFERLEASLEIAEQGATEAAALDRERTAPRLAELAVSVVIPVYNERETIVEIVRRVQSVGIHQEIVIVDDYSLDGTRDLLLVLDREPDIRVLLHGYNRGKGAALRTAFAAVQGEVVIVQDADLEYNPVDFPELLEPLRRNEADVVYGSRFLHNADQDSSRWHRFGNWLLTRLSNIFTGQGLTDMETCYKVFRRSVLEQIALEQDRFGFEPEITAKLSRLGYQIHEVPIRYDSRDYEQGKKIGVADAINALWCIARYR